MGRRLRKQLLRLELSEEQRQALAACRDAWREVDRSTMPADRPAAEQAIRSLYRMGGLPEPDIRWCGSPAALLIEHQRICEAGEETSGFSVAGQLGDDAWPLLWDQLSASAAGEAWRSLEGVMWRSFSHYWGKAEEGDLPSPDPNGRGLQFVENAGDGAAVIWTCRDVQQWEGRTAEFYVDHRWTAELIPLYAFAVETLGVKIRPAEPLLALARSCGGWIAHRGTALLCERPTVYATDERDRLHSWLGPALAWPDGEALHCWHGLRVPEGLTVSEDALTPKVIQRQRNVELRRVMLERYGLERFLGDVDAQLVDESEFGRLYLAPIATPVTGPTVAVMFVDVENATVEPDGTRKRYMLLVPDNLETARAAVAWTFGLEEHEYVLTAES
jgi:hypothetical protein